MPLAAADPKLEYLLSRASPEESDIPLKLILEAYTVINASSALECFLYGMHCILFAICCSILFKKRHLTTSRIFLAAAIVMFALSTADFSLTLRLQLVDVPKFIRGETNLNEVIRRNVPKSQLFVANNLIADTLLLYRCCMVWHFRGSVFAISVLLLLGDTVWGWIGAGTPQVFLSTASWEKFTFGYYWSIFCVNIIMTLLIVGRIWWVTKRAKPRLGSRDIRVYHTIIVIFAETAFIYSACLLIVIILSKLKPGPYASTLANVTVVRLVSIMPTLLIVQVTGTRSFDDRFKRSGEEEIEPPNISSRATSGMLDTIITTQASAGNNEVIVEREERPNGPDAIA